MTFLAAKHIDFGLFSAKWAIGSVALFHTAVASLAIGFAFLVTVLQIVAYRRRQRDYDMMAKRMQLLHVCMYNIGTINAIGLVFLLSGLYPEFWSQLFTNFFWPMIMEEVCFFLLATTLTFHYFFWEHLWGHKKLHIFMGALLTPLFFIQFYLINGMGGFMLTPGFAAGQVSQWSGTAGFTGYDFKMFYNPSFLMLTLHRTAANFAYGAFVAAGLCGIRLMTTKRERMIRYYEDAGRIAFFVAFAALLSLPVIGYFYSFVLKNEAYSAYAALMWGKGDVVAGGIDWWWLKHVIVAGMLGMGMAYLYRSSRARPAEGPPADTSASGASVPLTTLVWAVAIFYIVFYIAMGMVMTWFFFWMMLLVGVVGWMLNGTMLRVCGGSPRAVFLLMGILSFLTVMLGGYVREAARPRFVSQAGVHTGNDLLDRYSHYDDVYVPEERQKAPGEMTMRKDPDWPVPGPRRKPEAFRDLSDPEQVRQLISFQCSSCHTLERVRRYHEAKPTAADWQRTVARMRAYGMRIAEDEAVAIAEMLQQPEWPTTTPPGSVRIK